MPAPGNRLRPAPGYRFGLSQRQEGARGGRWPADPVHPGRRRGRARPVGWQAGREPAAGNSAVATRSAARACRLRATRVTPGGARRSGGSWRPWTMVRSWPAIRRARPSWSRRWLSSRRGKGSRAIVLIAAPFAGEGGWPTGEFGPAGGLGAGLPPGAPVPVCHGLGGPGRPVVACRSVCPGHPAGAGAPAARAGSPADQRPERRCPGDPQQQATARHRYAAPAPRSHPAAGRAACSAA